MTYAEAMNRVEVWFRYWDSPLVDRKKQDAEALAVLRQAVPLMEAAGKIPRWAALQIQPHKSEQSDTLMASIAFHKYPDLLERIYDLLAALPEAKDGPR